MFVPLIARPGSEMMVAVMVRGKLVQGVLVVKDGTVRRPPFGEIGAIDEAPFL